MPSASFSGDSLLRSCRMATNETLRQQVARLIDLGVNQKSIAKRLHVSETWLSRWVNKKRDTIITVDAMDRLKQYVVELAEVASQAPASMVGENPSAKGGPFDAGVVSEGLTPTDERQVLSSPRQRTVTAVGSTSRQSVVPLKHRANTGSSSLKNPKPLVKDSAHLSDTSSKGGGHGHRAISAVGGVDAKEDAVMATLARGQHRLRSGATPKAKTPNPKVVDAQGSKPAGRKRRAANR